MLVSLLLQHHSVAENLLHYLHRMGWNAMLYNNTHAQHEEHVLISDDTYKRLLQDHERTDFYAIITLGRDANLSSSLHLSVPMMLGKLHSELQNIVSQMQSRAQKNIRLGEIWQLDTTRAVLYKQHPAKEIFLTEREQALILFLLEHQNSPQTKDTILTHVWKYNSDVDSHTLETHIYRLRQKLLNTDPAIQVVLESKGYILSFF